MAFGANFWCQFFALMWICSFKGFGGFSMSRCAFLAVALIVLLPAGPCFAVDAKQKRPASSVRTSNNCKARRVKLSEMHGGSGRSARPDACRSRHRNVQFDYRATIPGNAWGSVVYPSQYQKTFLVTLPGTHWLLMAYIPETIFGIKS